MSQLRVVFMGTPAFAVPSLAALHHMPDVRVVGVVTAPDKPAGRGHQLSMSPVKEYALAHQLSVLQPTNLKAPEFLAELQALRADVQIVVAFRMLPQVVFAMPRLGSINLHASLLPDYRGAAPIHWAVINGEHETGLTTFYIQQVIDTGNIILQERLAIPDHYTTGQLHDEMMLRGAQLLVQTLALLIQGKGHGMPQAEQQAVHAAPKIFKEDAHIDWNRPAEQLYHFIRGMSPFPAAWCYCDEQVLKVFFSERTGQAVPTGLPPGSLRVQQGQLWVACADAWLHLTDLQLAGRKRMGDGPFLAGYKIDNQQLS